MSGITHSQQQRVGFGQELFSTALLTHAYENTVCKMAAILSRGRGVNITLILEDVKYVIIQCQETLHERPEGDADRPSFYIDDAVIFVGIKITPLCNSLIYILLKNSLKSIA